MKRLIFSQPLLLLAAILGGCTHPMTIKNLSTYQSKTSISLEQQQLIGLHAKAADINGHRLIYAIERDLLKYNAKSTTVVTEDLDKDLSLDILADISVLAHQRGSGWNFWADFPGFLIWFPTWHGYNYKVMYDIDIKLNDARSKKLIEQMFIPVRLNVKHADIHRTWVDGVAWPTLGLTALIGGLPHMNYDENVTPLVELEVAPILADYVAQEIAITLQHYNASPHDRFEKLKILLQEGIINQEEFELKSKGIIGDL